MAIELSDIGPVLGRIEPLHWLREQAPESGLFLVGGALRDALLGQPVGDIDIAGCMDPTATAQQLAAAHEAPWFWLDRDRRQSRVLIRNGAETMIFDFSPLRAADLAGDLAARDFTINSLALPLRDTLENRRIIDPLGGLEDLGACTLRMSRAQSLVADPLRILKGIRHAVTLGFVLEEETCKAMIHNAWRLNDVAAERVRQEIWAILGHPGAGHGLEILSTTGVGSLCWGADYDRHLPALLACLDGCRSAWQPLQQLEPRVAGWLAEEVEAGFTREVLLLWSLLLGRIRADLPAESAAAWLFSRKAQIRIAAIAGLKRSLLGGMSGLLHRPRALALWCRKHLLDPIDLLLTAVGLGALPCAGDDQVSAWVSTAAAAREQPATDLVSGRWLTEELGIPAGPEVGKALARVREAEISGEVESAEEAQAFLRRLHQIKD